MRRIAPLTALVCLLAGPAFGGQTLCAGRVELLSVTPQWVEEGQRDSATGLRVAVANRSGEAVLLQPVLMTGGRPLQGNPVMLVRRGEMTFALRLPADQPAGLPAATLIRALGASCRLT